MFAVLLVFFSSFLLDPAESPDVVISQVYGSGGNSGATYRNDFVELFNRGSSLVSLSGWSVQYSSATGSTWSKVDLTGNLGPGQYYLIQLASGGTSGIASSILVIPVEGMTGCPIRFDGVTGAARIKLPSQQAGTVHAIRLPLVDGALATCSLTANLECYAPRVVAGNLLSPEDGYRQMLIITRIGETAGPFIGIVFNDVESTFSFSIPGSNQFRALIDSSFPGTTPRIASIIPAGRSAWFKVWSQSDCAIVLTVPLSEQPSRTILAQAFRSARDATCII